ncbi:MAG: hypothetical protein U9N47_08195 [Thermodesulfobacteriota bacterium]|nr:hypothetical protein [Thermodesulfobacteriota bacterium]
MNVLTLIAILAAVAAVASAICAYAVVKRMGKQMEQFSAHELTRFSNEHNWNLYLQRSTLPPALPAWRNLSDKGWAWRVLHLNHLNLLQVAYTDHKRGLLGQKESDGWILMAKFWFSHLRSESSDVDIDEGRKTLRQVLKPEEGYSEEFRDWLRQNQIIPPNLFFD